MFPVPARGAPILRRPKRSSALRGSRWRTLPSGCAKSSSFWTFPRRNMTGWRKGSPSCGVWKKNIPQTKKGSLRFLRIPSAVSTSWNTRATGSRSWKRKRRRRMRLPKRRHARSPISGKLRQSGSRSASSASFVISACRRSALRCGFFPAKGKTPCPPPAPTR